MKRIYSCMRGHQARAEVTPTNRHLVCCPLCMVSTRLHDNKTNAIAEWNDSDSPAWDHWFTDENTPPRPVRGWMVRWWRGRFV